MNNTQTLAAWFNDTIETQLEYDRVDKNYRRYMGQAKPDSLSAWFDTSIFSWRMRFGWRLTREYLKDCGYDQFPA